MSPQDSQDTLWHIKEKKRKKRKRKKKSRKKVEQEEEDDDDDDEGEEEEEEEEVVHPLTRLAFDWKISCEPDAYNDDYDRCVKVFKEDVSIDLFNVLCID